MARNVTTRIGRVRQERRSDHCHILDHRLGVVTTTTRFFEECLLPPHICQLSQLKANSGQSEIEPTLPTFEDIGDPLGYLVHCTQTQDAPVCESGYQVAVTL